MRASIDYRITDDDNLSVAYTSAISPNSKSTENSNGTLSESSNIRTGDEQMHNFSADYKMNRCITSALIILQGGGRM